MRAILVRGSEDCLGGVESFPTFTLDTPTHFWYNRDRRRMKQNTTDEAKVAMKLAKTIDSATLNLDQVGVELARLVPHTFYNRFVIIAESAVEEQEKQNARQFNTLF